MQLFSALLWRVLTVWILKQFGILQFAILNFERERQAPCLCEATKKLYQWNENHFPIKMPTNIAEFVSWSSEYGAKSSGDWNDKPLTIIWILHVNEQVWLKNRLKMANQKNMTKNQQICETKRRNSHKLKEKLRISMAQRFIVLLPTKRLWY